MELRKALNRVTYGVKPGQLKEAEKLGWETWVKQQLSLENNDSECDSLIQNISYELSYKEKGKKHIKELSLFRYYASSEQIWNSIKGQDKPSRWLMEAGAVETGLVTWTKAIHSKNQLFEMLVEFWHNHFNVSVETEDYISCSFPIYDREVIRKNALGNFRSFTESVAKSPCMLLYLDNAFSKASPANENYARELFELHTLGAMHYYNHLYDDWKNVPGAENGESEGYIDEDIYEAARAFTGWTIGNGKKNHKLEFPSTGEFYYYDQWHDHYQKRVLGFEFKSHQDDMVDGHKVLDLVCYHKGTAKNLCTKLCKWFVSDTPSAELIEKTMEVWLSNSTDEDQLLKVVEFILLSDDFTSSLNTKIKRPNHLVLTTARILDLEPSLEWVWLMQQMGWKQFSWPLPTGHPDDANYWLNTDMMLKRWNSLPMLLHLNMENGNKTKLTQETLKLENTKLDTILDYWSERLLGEKLNSEYKTEMVNSLLADMEEMKGQEWSILAKDYPEGLEYKLIQVVGMIALSPEFHKR